VITLVSLLMNTDTDLLTTAHQKDRVATRSMLYHFAVSVTSALYGFAMLVTTSNSRDFLL